MGGHTMDRLTCVSPAWGNVPAGFFLFCFAPFFPPGTSTISLRRFGKAGALRRERKGMPDLSNRFHGTMGVRLEDGGSLRKDRLDVGVIQVPTIKATRTVSTIRKAA